MCDERDRAWSPDLLLLQHQLNRLGFKQTSGIVVAGIHRVRSILLAFLIYFTYSFTALADPVRVGDLVTVAGARDNQLNGFGLVVGLAGDGDKSPIYTQQVIANMLQRFGVNIQSLVTQITAKNVAAVIVTANIPAFAKPGSRIDIQVSSIGDANSLQGGVLLQTPLIGADNKVYAVAQGPVAVGGFSVGVGGGGGASVTKNFPTVGQIIGGAIVEREIPTTIVYDHSVELLLRDPNFISAALMADAINQVFTNSACALDSTSVQVHMPAGMGNDDLVDFIARLEDVEVTPDVPARVIINERTGTIVATANIHISSCAVACGDITISIASTPVISQPLPYSQGKTAITSQTTTQVTENKTAMVALPELPTVQKVAMALNSLGVTPRDMMAIFQAMKQAGALQADLEIR